MSYKQIDVVNFGRFVGTRLENVKKCEFFAFYVKTLQKIRIKPFIFLLGEQNVPPEGG
jgi:hypothetical protein